MWNTTSVKYHCPHRAPIHTRLLYITPVLVCLTKDTTAGLETQSISPSSTPLLKVVIRLFVTLIIRIVVDAVSRELPAALRRSLHLACRVKNPCPPCVLKLIYLTRPSVPFIDIDTESIWVITAYSFTVSVRILFQINKLHYSQRAASLTQILQHWSPQQQERRR